MRRLEPTFLTYVKNRCRGVRLRYRAGKLEGTVLAKDTVCRSGKQGLEKSRPQRKEKMNVAERRTPVHAERKIKHMPYAYAGLSHLERNADERDLHHSQIPDLKQRSYLVGRVVSRKERKTVSRSSIP